MTYEKHMWSEHPNSHDVFQKYWAEQKKTGKLNTMSLGYQDDPYY